jgi:hypothetical protein
MIWPICPTGELCDLINLNLFFGYLLIINLLLIFVNSVSQWDGVVNAPINHSFK